VELISTIEVTLSPTKPIEILSGNVVMFGVSNEGTTKINELLDGPILTLLPTATPQNSTELARIRALLTSGIVFQNSDGTSKTDNPRIYTMDLIDILGGGVAHYHSLELTAGYRIRLISQETEIIGDLEVTGDITNTGSFTNDLKVDDVVQSRTIYRTLSRAQGSYVLATVPAGCYRVTLVRQSGAELTIAIISFVNSSNCEVDYIEKSTNHTVSASSFVGSTLEIEVTTVGTWMGSVERII
jgi:hypothetical protein